MTTQLESSPATSTRHIHPPVGSAPERSCAHPRRQPQANVYPKVALVVDDEANVRALVAAILARKGWRVVEAPDVVAALTIARTRHLDLVVTDYEMPAFSGMELTQLLRSADAELPILMISGHLEIADRFLALPGGRTAFHAKPFGVEDLSARVDALVGAH